MSVLVAIDPGMNSPGYAVFRDGVLVGADRVRSVGEWADLEDGQRWLHVAIALQNEAYRFFRPDTTPLDVVFEKPQWYQRGKSKGDPNQLVGVAGVAAAFVGRCSAHYAVQVSSPTPADWIGQLPKVCPVCKGKKSKPAPVSFTQSMIDGARGRKKPKRIKTQCQTCLGSAWLTPRGRFIQARLKEAEFQLVPDQNDAIDAVGLGLWKLGRLQPRSIFSNGADGR